MTSAATVIAAPASCTGVGTIPESADTAKAPVSFDVEPGL